jgi:hypothetical protein
MSMFLSKLKVWLSITIIAAPLTFGVVAVAQQKYDRPQAKPIEGTARADDGWTYEVIASKPGMAPRQLAIVRLPIADTVRIDTPDAVIVFEPKRLTPKAADQKKTEHLYRDQFRDRLDVDAFYAGWRNVRTTQDMNALLKDATCVACHRSTPGALIEDVHAQLRNSTGAHSEMIKAIEKLRKDAPLGEPAAPKAVENRPPNTSSDQPTAPKSIEKGPWIDARDQSATKASSGDRLDQLEKKVDSILDVLKAMSGTSASPRR